METGAGLQLRHNLNGHQAPIHTILWDETGSTLITAAADDVVRFWDITNGSELHSFTNPDLNRILFTSDHEKIIVSRSTHYGIDILDGQQGTPLTTLYGHTAPIHALAVTPDETRLISASADGTLGVWGLVNGIQHMRLNSSAGGLNALAITPDSRYVFAGGAGYTIEAWNLDTAKQLDLRMKHSGRVTALALTPDGCTLVSASDDLTIRFWNTEDGHLFHIIEGHTAPLVGLAFSPDGGVLASYDAGGTLRLWRWDSWEQLVLLNIPPQPASRLIVAFHPHAPLLAVPGDSPNEVAILDVDYRALLFSPSGDQTVRYTTVRVALVGDGGVGKTGLGHRLAYGTFQPSAPTHGQQFWILDRLNRTDVTHRIEREVILWDFAGQPDYRLIHTLFLDQVDIALLLFETANRYEPMRGVEYWLHQLATRNANQTTRKILVGAKLSTTKKIMRDELR